MIYYDDMCNEERHLNERICDLEYEIEKVSKKMKRAKEKRNYFKTIIMAQNGEIIEMQRLLHKQKLDIEQLKSQLNQ